jgi:hypothetical protein
MNDELDLGDAAEYILGERPTLHPDEVWAVLNELGRPPAKDELAMVLLQATHPEVAPATVAAVLREWRAYATLAAEPDWDDD